MHARPLRLPLIGLARAQPPLAEKDRDEERGDAEEFAQPSALDGRAHDREKKKERQHGRRGRHEDRATSQADGGLGASDWGPDGAGAAGPVRRMRRNAQATGS